MSGEKRVSSKAGSRPTNLSDALRDFRRGMAQRSVPQKRRAYSVRWVERFNGSRVQVLRRPFQTCGEVDVVAFLERQHEAFGSADWQLRQASEAVVLFFARCDGSGWD